MTNFESELRKQLSDYRVAMGLLQKIQCTKEENKEFFKLKQADQALPDGVYFNSASSDFYRVSDSVLDEIEINEYLVLKKLMYLKTIKNVLVFFLIAFIVTLVITLPLLL